MRCKNCRKEVSPKISIQISRLDTRDTVGLCNECHQNGGREVVKQRFGSLMASKANAKPNNPTHYDIHGSNERASRQRGIDKSREVRRAS